MPVFWTKVELLVWVSLVTELVLSVLTFEKLGIVAMTLTLPAHTRPELVKVADGPVAMTLTSTLTLALPVPIVPFELLTRVALVPAAIDVKVEDDRLVKVSLRISVLTFPNVVEMTLPADRL